jgi:hypothetical protein
MRRTAVFEFYEGFPASGIPRLAVSAFAVSLDAGQSALDHDDPAENRNQRNAGDFAAYPYDLKKIHYFTWAACQPSMSVPIAAIAVQSGSITAVPIPKIGARTFTSIGAAAITPAIVVFPSFNMFVTLLLDLAAETAFISL